MKNSIEKQTGATITIKKEGNILSVFVQGKAGSVLHAVTLLYNFGCFESFPEYVDHETTCAMYKTPLRTMAKGIIAYVLNQIVETEEIACGEAKVAIFSAIRTIQMWIKLGYQVAI